MFKHLYYRRIMNAGLGCRISLWVLLLLITSQMEKKAQNSPATSKAEPGAASQAPLMAHGTSTL